MVIGGIGIARPVLQDDVKLSPTSIVKAADQSRELPGGDFGQAMSVSKNDQARSGHGEESGQNGNHILLSRDPGRAVEPGLLLVHCVHPGHNGGCDRFPGGWDGLPSPVFRALGGTDAVSSMSQIKRWSASVPNVKQFTSICAF
ncbi:hypothetical protein D3867_00070 [Azospirillum argentinense]|uniref:Uncharacterized protein n=1 Tax=Azospirillum brasilense TaxID=192 RepID=A0A4D8Q320_AZOBR|nr:hypothetical protein D3867_00070 [Azospirillum argentinense]